MCKFNCSNCPFTHDQRDAGACPKTKDPDVQIYGDEPIQER